MNKQQQLGAAIGGGAVVLILVGYMLFGRGSGEPETPVVAPVTPAGTASGTPTGTSNLGGGTKAEAPAFKPGSLGAFNAASIGGVRKDPFLISWKDNTTPPPNIFDSVEPIRVSPASVEEPQEEIVEVREAPSRRYSGFMNGDGVFAVLENGGETEIVQPGSVTKLDGYKVVSITNEQVFLRKQEGNVIRTQVVLYGDAPPTLTGARPSGGGFGQAGGSGSPLGGGRRPGGGKSGGAGSE